MPKSAKRVVIDTNIWISYLLNSNGFKKLDDSIKRQEIILLFSQELLDEFIDVSRRPKFKKYFAEKDINLLMAGLNKNAHFITVNNKVTICRDPKDNFLLTLSQKGKADYLVTGDSDLLVLKTYKSTEILSPNSFLKKL